MTEHVFSLILVFFLGRYCLARDDIKGLKGWYSFSRDDTRFSQSGTRTAGTIQLFQIFDQWATNKQGWYRFPPIRSNSRATPPNLNWPMKCCCFQFVLFKTMTNLGFLVRHERHQFRQQFVYYWISARFCSPLHSTKYLFPSNYSSVPLIWWKYLLLFSSSILKLSVVDKQQRHHLSKMSSQCVYTMSFHISLLSEISP